MDPVSIDGLALSVVKPATVAELCALVKSQRAKKEAVYPVGGRTMLDFGLPPTKPGVAVDTTALNQVIDYPARDMTITVQAGITFAKLQEVLAKENQWLPLDVPDPERMTLGGLIACNVSGPRRYGYGTLRDYLIGIEFVNDDGVVIHGGGRVVKNVAGYDLMKLHIGALGTMGVITQVTLKVLPRPEYRSVLVMKMPQIDIKNTLDILSRSTSKPCAVELIISDSDEYMIILGFEGKKIATHWQLQVAKSELSVIKSQELSEYNDTNAAFLLKANRAGFINSEMPFIYRVTIKPSDLHLLIDGMKWNWDDNPSLHIGCEAMNGIMVVTSNESHDFCRSESIVVRRAPTAWKTPERVFGKPTPAWELMAHIKHTLDPENVFNPGRMFA